MFKTRDLKQLSSTAEALKETDSANFLELVSIAGLDPSSDFRFSNLRSQDFSNSDLTGFDFTGAFLLGCNFKNAKISGAVFKDALINYDDASLAADWSPEVERRIRSNYRTDGYNLKTRRSLRGQLEQARSKGAFQPISSKLDFQEFEFVSRGVVSTGFDELDRILGGLHPSELVIVAGRPSIGKTSLATSLALNAVRGVGTTALESNGAASVAFFSLELSAQQIATRLLGQDTGVQIHKIRSGHLDRDEVLAMRESSAELDRLPFYVDDQGGLSIEKLAERARGLNKSVGVDLIVIDYLQLLVGSGRSANRVQEITEITSSLKALAKELQVPIIALSQLSRQVEQSVDKRPMLKHLRESGSLEQDADVVMLLFREAYYLQRQEPGIDGRDTSTPDRWAAWRQRMDEVVGLAEIIVAKNRNGPSGSVILGFEEDFGRFSNVISAPIS